MKRKFSKLTIVSFIIAGLLFVLGVGGILALVMIATQGATFRATMIEYGCAMWSALSGQRPVTNTGKFVIEQLTNASIFGLTIIAIALSSLYLVDAKAQIEESAKRNLPANATVFNCIAADVSKYALPIMKKFYNNATSIRIVAGDYNWLLEDKLIAERIYKLLIEDKARVYSYKTQEQIISAWGDGLSHEIYRVILDNIKFINKKHYYRCSLITYQGGAEALVFLSESGDDFLAGNTELRTYAIYEYHTRSASRTVVEMAKGLFNTFDASRQNGGGGRSPDK
ncbi:hypothetical protein Rleg9DRAFT_7357 [Rhizobium leguminosarum bv. trifolii WSM597]|uniref:Uncharacterized protein n=1 Tax=Rhizobium leguminosarum bv. trifolii WSM597 TaxID=754764 RepID=J0HD00_RHILT|nr:hypothetical protein [Rhizobium leguminosarum]EJB02321.1 hypothetical protein Rleg9DRAFT_1117 [Rhizobium leguminosarum bv. trifolii WSM597]EJB08310.1 hypothetical protein Rleg9DRAFT_7357 [Rhizobium leguminosarum bv. trifolii WSM597]